MPGQRDPGGVQETDHDPAADGGCKHEEEAEVWDVQCSTCVQDTRWNHEYARSRGRVREAIPVGDGKDAGRYDERERVFTVHIPDPCR